MLYSPVSCWVSSESSWRPVQPSEAHSGSPRQPDQVLHSARQQYPPHPPPLWAAPELRCCSEAKDTGRKVNINIWRKQYKSPIRILKKNLYIYQTYHWFVTWKRKLQRINCYTLPSYQPRGCSEGSGEQGWQLRGWLPMVLAVWRPCIHCIPTKAWFWHCLLLLRRLQSPLTWAEIQLLHPDCCGCCCDYESSELWATVKIRRRQGIRCCTRCSSGF